MTHDAVTRSPRYSLVVSGLAWLLASGGATIAQTAPPQNPAAALKQSLAANQAALKKYSWIETTQVLHKGEVKKQEEKQCYYGADGKVQKTPLPAAAPSAPPSGGRGRIGHDIVEHKVEETKEYMAKVTALVHLYVPPDPQKIKAAEAAGNLSVTPSEPTTTLTVKNYVKDGDSISLGFATATKKLTSYNVQSYVEKPKDDDVTLAVTFGTLADGTSYPQNVVLDVPNKDMQVKVTNSGYKKSGS
jgi:hypothetical protein